MKKLLFIFVLISLVALLYVWIEQSFVTHRPIDGNRVEAIQAWVNGEQLHQVLTEEYMNVVKWFNQYKPTRVKKVEVPVPAEAQIVINLINGDFIILNYKEGKIYTARSEDDYFQKDYVFLDDSPQLEHFFEDLIQKCSNRRKQ